MSTTCICMPVVVGQDDVHAGAGLTDGLRGLVVELPHRVRELARGVNHRLRSHVELRA